MRRFKGMLPRTLHEDAFVEVLQVEAEISDLQWQISKRMEQIENIYRNSGRRTTELLPGDYLLCWPKEKKGKDFDRDKDRVLYKFSHHAARESGSPDLMLMVRKVRRKDGHKTGTVFAISPQSVDIVFPNSMFWYTIQTILNTYKLL